MPSSGLGGFRVYGLGLNLKPFQFRARFRAGGSVAREAELVSRFVSD